MLFGFGTYRAKSEHVGPWRRRSMSITTQGWQSVESGRDLARPKKAADPMAYLAVLVILAAIMALMSMFCSIGSASEHGPDGPHAGAASLTTDD